ncbi:MAG: nucleotide-binding domain containing protein, partial [Verrucomicrobiota bacterium]
SASASAQLFISTARTKGLAVSSMPLRMANHLSDKKSLQEWKKKTQTALRFNSAVIAAIDLPLQAKSKSMEKYSEQLLAVAGSILDSESIGQIFIEGGATASSLVRQMGWSSLSVVHEWAPGVATMRVENDGGQFITIKPGSYQWPPEIVRLAATERIPFPVA